MASRRYLAVLVAVFVSAPACAWAINPVFWQVEISTSGEDVFWTSPTSLTPGIAEYDWSYEITELTANVEIIGDQDLLGMLDETTGAGTAAGLPFLVVDDMLSDDTTGSSAHIRIEVDAAGVGHASGTDITLGSITVPILGALDINRVDLKADVSILGVPTGDYDRDGDVDANDYQVWQADFSSTTNLRADGNRNTVVDAADYVVWRKNLGVDTTPAAGLAAAVPEPTTSLLAMVAGLAAVAVRKRRVRPL